MWVKDLTIKSKNDKNIQKKSWMETISQGREELSLKHDKDGKLVKGNVISVHLKVWNGKIENRPR